MIVSILIPKCDPEVYGLLQHVAMGGAAPDHRPRFLRGFGIQFDDGPMVDGFVAAEFDRRTDPTTVRVKWIESEGDAAGEIREVEFRTVMIRAGDYDEDRSIMAIVAGEALGAEAGMKERA